MQIIKINPYNLIELKKFTAQIAAEIKIGKTLVYPTDTLYGLGGDGTNQKTIGKIFKIKKRNLKKALPLLVKNIEMAKKLAFIDKKTEKILNAAWPGPITFVLWKRKIVPLSLTGGAETVALRYNNHWFLNELFRHLDFPLIATSANISGKENIYKIGDLIQTFKTTKIKPDLLIDAGDINPNTPASTIIDLTKQKPLILRVGAVKPKELLQILEV